jgi:DNA-binding MarR family transcriptional regulator
MLYARASLELSSGKVNLSGAHVVKLDAKDEMGERSLTSVLRRVQRLVQKRMQARFAEADPSFEEWMALRLLAEGFVETAGDMAREFGIATGATTRLIDSLEKQGFIERDSKEGDRRVVLLRITKNGATHYKCKLPDMLQCWNEVLYDWKKDEVEQLVTSLMKLQDSLLRTMPKCPASGKAGPASGQQRRLVLDRT